MIKIGFTGPRDGMFSPQDAAVVHLIETWTRILPPALLSGLHGDCVGGDARFDAILERFGVNTFCRPCTWEKFRARTRAEVIAEPVAPMVRNRAIVADVAVMIACPPTERKVPHSGTWATIGFTRRVEKPLALVLPNGEITFERWRPDFELPDSDPASSAGSSLS